MHSIDDLYEQILIESNYSEGEREKMSGFFLSVIAVVLILFSVILKVEFNSDFSFWMLFIPSLILGFIGLVLYYYGNSMVDDAACKSKALERSQEEQRK
ncbi:MAG: hypothetical protein WC375_00845 [Methanomassiliicoccales archaeon]|jgi:dipeptide/tripeptide permease